MSACPATNCSTYPTRSCAGPPCSPQTDGDVPAVELARAASRDKRVFVAHHAYNAHQEARGWAMAGEPAEVDRTLGRADKLAERTV